MKAVKVPGETKIDDEFAKSLGLEGLDKLKELLKAQLEQETAGLTRTQMKRQLLDALAAGHDFPVPGQMVDAEFEQIWQQLQHEASHEEDPEAAMKEIEAEKDDYRKIAERRVRLGLLLSEIGQANGVDVTAQEMNRLIAQAAQQYGPEDRQRFIQYIQQEPMAAAQLRAPLYEDKVVDFLFDKAEITDRETTREQLEAAIESEDGFATGTHVHNHDHDHDHDHGAKKPAKAKAKKAVTEEAASEDAAAEEAPKKATRAKKAAPAEGEADAAEATEEAPAKKPRAKKTAAPAEGEAEAAEAPAKKPRAKKAAPTE